IEFHRRPVTEADKRFDGVVAHLLRRFADLFDCRDKLSHQRVGQLVSVGSDVADTGGNTAKTTSHSSASAATGSPSGHSFQSGLHLLQLLHLIIDNRSDGDNLPN